MKSIWGEGGGEGGGGRGEGRGEEGGGDRDQKNKLYLIAGQKKDTQ